MSTTQIIQLMGVLYFVFGLAFIFNKKYYLNVSKELIKSKIFMFAGGYIALILGLIIVLFFNTFEISKEGLVTVIGWISILKGGTILLFPKFFLKFSKGFVNKKYFNLIGFSITIIGLFLIYLGFLA